MMEKECKSNTKRLLFGILFILAGLVALGNELRYIQAKIPWAPLAIIFLGIYFVIKPKKISQEK